MTNATKQALTPKTDLDKYVQGFCNPESMAVLENGMPVYVNQVPFGVAKEIAEKIMAASKLLDCVIIEKQIDLKNNASAVNFVTTHRIDNRKMGVTLYNVVFCEQEDSKSVLNNIAVRSLEETIH